MTTLLDNMEYDVWYMATLSGSSTHDMQRKFAQAPAIMVIRTVDPIRARRRRGDVFIAVANSKVRTGFMTLEDVEESFIITVPSPHQDSIDDLAKKIYTRQGSSMSKSIKDVVARYARSMYDSYYVLDKRDLGFGSILDIIKNQPKSMARGNQSQGMALFFDMRNPKVEDILNLIYGSRGMTLEEMSDEFYNEFEFELTKSSIETL